MASSEMNDGDLKIYVTKTFTELSKYKLWSLPLAVFMFMLRETPRPAGAPFLTEQIYRLRASASDL